MNLANFFHKLSTQIKIYTVKNGLIPEMTFARTPIPAPPYPTIYVNKIQHRAGAAPSRPWLMMLHRDAPP